jgi:esterase/lipase
MNYYHQDNKEPFTMATRYEQKKQELCDQVKEFRESIDTNQYDSIILIGTSLGGVLFNQLMDYF